MSGTNPSDGMVGEAVSDTGQGREPIGQDEGHRPGRGAEAHVAAPQLRLLAFAIDLVVVACVLGPTFVVDRYTTLPSVVVYLGGAGVFLYYVSMTTWLMHGQTAGKVVCGLAVRRVHGGAPPRSSRGLLWSVGRHSVGYVVTDVLGLGTALALVTPRRRCLHDYAFGSEVVMVERVQTPRAYWDRYRAFWKPFKEAYEEIQERYVWLFFPWKWLTKAFGVIAALLLAFRPTAASASTTPAGPAPAAASKVGMATVWAGTTVTTVALVSTLLPPGELDIAGTWVLVQVETANRDVFDPPEFADQSLTFERVGGELVVTEGPDFLVDTALEPRRIDADDMVAVSERSSRANCVDGVSGALVAEDVYAVTTSWIFFRVAGEDDRRPQRLEFSYVDVGRKDSSDPDAETCPVTTRFEATATAVRQ